MTAGLPGIGITGLFFLLSALLMPGVELMRTVAGRSSLTRWRMVLRQFTIAAGVIASFSVTVWTLGLVVRSAAGPRGGAGGAEAAQAIPDPFPVSPLVIAFAALLLVLIVAKALHLVLRRGDGRRADLDLARLEQVAG